METQSTAIEKERANIAQCGELLRTQQISPVELVDTCLSRIEEWNPRLNAFITVLAPQALEQARLSEADIKSGKWRGPLHGIPVGIKDFYDTAGIKTTAGFDHFKDRVPKRDAVVVSKLKEAGAIIIGKTNMHALGMGTTGLESYFGPVRNPWNPEHIPGGSSSGSAAAVASGMCYATVDTDAIGSCRLPAACCGVVGFKGTYGLINTQGILEGEEDPGEMIRWFSHPGIMTRAVEDIAVMLDVLATNHECRPARYVDAMTESRRMRIGVANNFRCDQEVGEAFGKAVELISGLGYSTTSVAAPLRTPAGDLSGIESDRASIAAKVFHDIDVLLLPTTTTTVPKIKDVRNKPQALSAENTVFANYYGLPAISVPCGFDRNGLPLGLQIVGKPWDEVTAIHLANQFEMAASAITNRGGGGIKITFP
jgi:aspartyl-tRNA(Asn)/glutamyl-tRNA(Gln) amidotransferase subunit A